MRVGWLMKICPHSRSGPSIRRGRVRSAHQCSCDGIGARSAPAGFYLHGEAIVNFREAGKMDVERIALLHADSWRRTYRGMMPDEFLDGDVLSNRVQVWHERLAACRPDQFVFLAEEDSRLAGFVCAFSNEDPTWGSYIDNLHVSHESRGRKAGAVLMAHAAKWLNDRHPHAGVYLWVMEANGPARRFYERLGASNAGIVDKRDPAGGSAPSCRYVWKNPQYLADAANMMLNIGASRQGCKE